MKVCDVEAPHNKNLNCGARQRTDLSAFVLISSVLGPYLSACH